MLGSKHSVTGHTRQAGEGQAELQEETYNFTKKLFVTIHFSCLQKIVALRQVIIICKKRKKKRKKKGVFGVRRVLPKVPRGHWEMYFPGDL